MTSKGGSITNNGGGLQSIPAASRKMVHSLKEIVNSSEAEIYAMLKECNMDPNEAVNRLLTLDPFHQVKSKREKKKDTKDVVEPKPRGASGRGSKAGSDRYVGHSGSTQFSSFEQGTFHGKSAYKKENGVNPYIGATSSINRQPPGTSNSISFENKVMTAGTIDSYPASSQHQVYQPAWSGPPGHVSMADIVKMGRPHGKAMNSSQHVSHYMQVPRSNVSHLDANLSEYHVTKVSALDHEAGEDAEQQTSPDDDWPVDDHIQADIGLHVMEPTSATGLHVDMSNSSTNRSNQLPQSQAGELQLADTSIENISSTCSGSIRIPPARDDNSSLFNNELCSDMGSYQLQRHNFENHEDKDVEVHVSSVTTNMQHLSVEEDHELLHEEENATVIIPDHLQVQSAECLHLSFGSFGTGPYASRTVTLKHNLEDASVDVVASPDGHLEEARKLEYYDNEPIRAAANENLIHRDGTTMESYEPLTASEPPEDLDEAVVPRENDYGYPPSTSSYAFENEQQLNAALAHSQSISKIQNLPQFSNSLQHAYSNSRPNSLLTSNPQATRESDLSYSPFSTTQSMAAKFGNTLPSIGGTTLSMPDMLKAAGFSSNQSAVPLNNLGTGGGPSSLPQQHIAVHPYSQPAHPLGPFANMISYPFMPPHQSYTYMPSAFQQALASNGPYHHHQQSLASLLPQYKNSVSSSNSLPPQSASGYSAGFGNSNNIQNNFPMNPPAAAPGHSTMGYDDLMASLQQNENSQLWLHGAGSRTMPTVSPNTYYSLTGQQSQQAAAAAAAAAGFRQSQQQQQQPSSQNYGYQNFYQSQAAEMAAMEQHLHHQHQNPRGDGLLSSQGGQSSSKQSHHQQAWQNIY